VRNFLLKGLKNEKIVYNFYKNYKMSDEDKRLLAIGLSNYKSTKDPNMELEIASWYGYFDIVKYLVCKGVDKTRGGSIILAAREGHLSIVQFLVENGFDVNACSTDGYTAICHASANGHLSVVQYLVEKGADIHVKNENPVCMASMYGHLSVVQFLEEKGCKYFCT
jgi:ankyrin repeat protein